MRTLTDRISAFPNENCNKTNLTYIRVLSTSVQLQRILKIYLTAVMVVHVHGSVYFFYQINKSIQSPHNQSGCIISIAMWACSAVRHPLAHTRVTSQNTVTALGHAHRRAPYVYANCSLNFTSSLLCRSPILLLISTQSSETRATFLSIASILSISKTTERNKAKRTRKALPREGELDRPPLPEKSAVFSVLI